MKTRTKKILLIVLIPLGGFLGFVAFNVFYGVHYAHQHCIKGAGIAFELYASGHQGQFPFSTNGFGGALLLLVQDNDTAIHNICGPDDDGHLYFEALTNHTVMPEEKCTRVYVQGLCETNDPQICILFDRNSCPGGDHFRSPWGHPLREICMLDGSMQAVSDDGWPEFSRQQVELLVAAGFSRTNALHFYPAAR